MLEVKDLLLTPEEGHLYMSSRTNPEVLCFFHFVHNSITRLTEWCTRLTVKIDISLHLSLLAHVIALSVIDSWFFVFRFYVNILI